MKIRFYATPNSWWYTDISLTRTRASVYILGKCVTAYWGPNAKYIP